MFELTRRTTIFLGLSALAACGDARPPSRAMHRGTRPRCSASSRVMPIFTKCPNR